MTFTGSAQSHHNSAPDPALCPYSTFVILSQACFCSSGCTSTLSVKAFLCFFTGIINCPQEVIVIKTHLFTLHLMSWVLYSIIVCTIFKMSILVTISIDIIIVFAIVIITTTILCLTMKFWLF